MSNINVHAKLAYVSHLAAQNASDKLNTLANDQEGKIKEKKKLRDLQEKLDAATSDGVITEDEQKRLKAAFVVRNFDEHDPDGLVYQLTHLNEDDKHEGHFSTKANKDKGVSETDAKENEDKLTAAKDMLKNDIEDVEDSESMVNFKIQLGMSELQAAESNRASFMKRLEDHSGAMRQKWQG